MFIEPLALFIIGEVVVVIIIIITFLFYKSRLLRVLLAVWHEMRLKRQRHDSPLSRKIAQLQEDNRKLKQKIEDLVEGGAETYSDQMQSRLDALAEQEPDDNADPLTIDDEEEESHRTRAILRAFYQFEAARSDPLRKDIRAAEDTLLEQLKIQLGRDPDEEESEYVKDQTARLLQRVAELEPLEQQHAHALSELKQARSALKAAEGRAAALKSVQRATQSNSHDPLRPGSAHDEEIYRLKCERFDMMESINKLRLQLQKMAGDGDTSDLTQLQNEQLKHQEKYIQEAEVAFSLMEEDLATAKSTIGTLEAKLKNHEAQRNHSGSDRKAEQQIARDNIAAYAEAQKSSMHKMRENLAALRKAEKLEEREALIQTQEKRLAALERAVQESDTCVAIMENELHEANVTIEKLKSEIASNPAASADEEELEALLQQFMTDSEDLVACLKGLEDQNEALRQQLLARGVSPDELPEPLEGPTSSLLADY